METLKLQQKYRWLVTGCAGFIGSHLAEFLLKNNQIVFGLDNFFNGSQNNLDEIVKNLTPEQLRNFKFVKGDIRDSLLCLEMTKEIDFVLHQAAVGSVPRSIATPDVTFDTNIKGFFEILNASRINSVKKFIFASSSSVYGSIEDHLKTEERIGQALSPYGWSKQTNETLAANFRQVYNMNIIGLRYFNVFGPRQNPNGDYAAVIPKWITNFINNKQCFVFGTGNQSRDFCFVENVIQANINSVLQPTSKTDPWIFNIAVGEQTSLLMLFEYIKKELESQKLSIKTKSNVYLEHKEARNGDVINSLANIERARQFIKYQPLFNIKMGLIKTIDWYVNYKQMEL